HGERLLLHQTRRHDLPKEPQHLLLAQWGAIARARHAQHLRLALRLVELRGAARERLRSPDDLPKLRPLVDERMNLLVDGIDARPYPLKIRRRLARASRPLRRHRSGSRVSLS